MPILSDAIKYQFRKVLFSENPVKEMKN